jgi:hypothetical protein
MHMRITWSIVLALVVTLSTSAFAGSWGGGLSGQCRIARSLGGPCGCFASELLCGHSVRELWLANNWLGFPRVSPSAANAAVWPGRHVAAVVPGSYSNGSITVRDSWRTHRVSTAGLVFVAASCSGVSSRLEGLRHAQHASRHRRHWAVYRHHRYWGHRHYAKG